MSQQVSQQPLADVLPLLGRVNGHHADAAKGAVVVCPDKRDDSAVPPRAEPACRLEGVRRAKIAGHASPAKSRIKHRAGFRKVGVSQVIHVKRVRHESGLYTRGARARSADGVNSGTMVRRSAILRRRAPDIHDRSGHDGSGAGKEG
jgi:hypothetical protein